MIELRMEFALQGCIVMFMFFRCREERVAVVVLRWRKNIFIL